LLAISAGAFRGLLATSPDLSQRVHALSSQRRASLDGRVGAASSRATESANARHFLARFLEQLMGGPAEAR
jgi:CRP-like cAMP-binding protein